jgi:hypothetical protein
MAIRNSAVIVIFATLGHGIAFPASAAFAIYGTDPSIAPAGQSLQMKNALLSLQMNGTAKTKTMSTT